MVVDYAHTAACNPNLFRYCRHECVDILSGNEYFHCNTAVKKVVGAEHIVKNHIPISYSDKNDS